MGELAINQSLPVMPLAAFGNITDRGQSRPFVLITGTVIGLILLIGGSVSLLYTIGGQELPSVLMGSAVVGRRD